MDYTEFFSRRAKLSRPSPIRRYAKMVRDSTTPLVNMAPGYTSDERSHFVGAKFELRDGSSLELDKEDMRIAQQYNNSDGIVPLREFLTDVTVKLHNPPNFGDPNEEKALRVIVTGGNLHALGIATATLLNEGDKCLLPEYGYSSFMGQLKLMNVDFLSYRVESDGPNIEHLEETLSRWNPEDKENWDKRPKVLTIVPNGGNPTGETTSLEKRHKIYALARKYNLIIIEDDAYYFLQFSESRIPSLLSMDTDGRVVRCDTFSKFMGPGFRAGWLSGPNALVTKMLFELQYMMQHASVLTQVTLNKLLRQWGMEEFLRNANDQRDFYWKRRDFSLQSAEKHLKGLATWTVPQGGMFLWIKATVIDDGEKFLTDHAIKNRFMMTPGSIFAHDHQAPCPYLRLAFTSCTEDKLDEGIKALATALREAADEKQVKT
ncbi:kynurenine/alpha-aminoadipate aminotransferase, mitochondrial-like [Diadema antillarum]|uniref:kynurenine/alpha-aminoadipate aminotransferase, mitochondrial-like n=1 Tax=Diadema antillarum TaxID=105358 RepID=UPI003A88824C